MNEPLSFVDEFANEPHLLARVLEHAVGPLPAVVDRQPEGLPSPHPQPWLAINDPGVDTDRARRWHGRSAWSHLVAAREELALYIARTVLDRDLERQALPTPVRVPAAQASVDFKLEGSSFSDAAAKLSDRMAAQAAEHIGTTIPDDNGDPSCYVCGWSPTLQELRAAGYRPTQLAARAAIRSAHTPGKPAPGPWGDVQPPSMPALDFQLHQRFQALLAMLVNAPEEWTRVLEVPAGQEALLAGLTIAAQGGSLNSAYDSIVAPLQNLEDES